MSTKHTTADDPTETGWTQVGLTLLHRGWSVGKKVAIAGAAISVAPVLVPPLLVFSAFGLALSVPFGIFCAGMVGTEQLMRYLLPLGPGREVRQEDREEESEMVEEAKGYVGERASKREENAERKGDDVMVETLAETVEEGRENGEREDDDDAIFEIPSERDAVNGEDREMKKNDIVSKRASEPEKNGEMKNDDARGDTDDNKAIVERIIDGNNATVDKDFITMEKVEIKLETVTSTALNERAGTCSADAESRLSVDHVGEVKDRSAIGSAGVESPATSDGEVN